MNLSIAFDCAAEQVVDADVNRQVYNEDVLCMWYPQTRNGAGETADADNALELLALTQVTLRLHFIFVAN